MAPKEKREGPEERILRATIECLERDGVQAVTTRSIARQADVNVAAINYYFRSKERLLKEAMEASIAGIFDSLPELGNQAPTDAREALVSFFDRFLRTALAYRSRIRSHLYAPMLEDDYSGPYAQQVGRFREELRQQLAAAMPGAGSTERAHAAAWLLSATLMPALFPRLFTPHLEHDLSQDTQRRDYLRSLLSAVTGAG